MKTIKSRMQLAAAVALIVASGASVAQAENLTMTVDARAPIAAILLPEVSVRPNGAANIAATEALPVTLLPTVHVTARAETLALVTLPTVHVSARAPRVADTGGDTDSIAAAAAPTSALSLPSTPTKAATHALRIEAMPR